MDVEQRARELLAAEYDKVGGWFAAECIRNSDARWPATASLNAIIAALAPPDGSDQNLLELAATFETCIPFLPSAGQRNIGKAVAQLRHMAMGYVLVPVEPTEAMLKAGSWVEPPGAHGQEYIEKQGAAQCWKLMMNARPEVPDGRG